LVKRINQWRFKTDLPRQKIEEIITKHKNPEEKTIVLRDINKVIKYEKEENLSRLLQYLKNLAENTQILPDFTFL